jgi:hypothetical protein
MPQPGSHHLHLTRGIDRSPTSFRFAPEHSFPSRHGDRIPALRHPVTGPAYLRPELVLSGSTGMAGGSAWRDLRRAAHLTRILNTASHNKKGPRAYCFREPLWPRCRPLPPSLAPGPWRTRCNLRQVWYTQAARGAPPPGATSPAGPQPRGAAYVTSSNCDATVSQQNAKSRQPSTVTWPAALNWSPAHLPRSDPERPSYVTVNHLSLKISISRPHPRVKQF